VRTRVRLAAIITRGEGTTGGSQTHAGREARKLDELLSRDHTLNGAILFGLDGYVVELQARAMQVLRDKVPLAAVTKISRMARVGVRESLDRIAGALAKLDLAESEVSVPVNLAPADLPKDGSWLDLPLAILMLQAAGTLRDRMHAAVFVHCR
jgi:magnesium chelatase family protein